MSLTCKASRGRDDDGGGISFKQQDIASLVEVSDHRHMHASRYPLHERQGELMLNLCVSDLIKAEVARYSEDVSWCVAPLNCTLQ